MHLNFHNYFTRNIPPLFIEDNTSDWSSYPLEFVDKLPSLKLGYLYCDGTGEHAQGYYATGDKLKYDTQTVGQPNKGLVLAKRDVYDNEISIEYDDYHLLPVKVTDPGGMSVSSLIDYRLLAPWQLTDPNENVTRTAFNALGLVTKIAVCGKVNGSGHTQGDTLVVPGSTFEYDFFAFANEGDPISVKKTVREHHINAPYLSSLPPAERNAAIEYSEQAPVPFPRLIGASHVLDNLFNIVPIEELLSLKDTLGMRNFLDGNMRYVDRTVSESSGMRIQYSGMYQTGFAIDDDNITLFALPFVTREEKKQSRVKIPLSGLNHGGFMAALASGAKADLGIEKIVVYGPGGASLMLLNIYSNPRAGSIGNFDPDAFLGLTMTRDEYDAISSELSNYNKNFHPVFLQVQSDVGQESQGGSQPYRKAEFQLAGYNAAGNRETIDLSSSEYPSFYGIELNNSQYFNTDLAGSLEGSPVVENPTAITIGHNPYDSSDERKKYDEVREALILIKSHLRDEFNEIQSLLSDGKMDIMPKFIADSGNAKYNGSREEYRKYRIEIKYDDLGASPLPSGAVIAGHTEQERADIEIEHDSGSSTPGKSTADILKDGDDPYINKSEYESLALNNNKTPEDIAEQFLPKIKTYVSSTNDSPQISVYSEFTPITYLADSGRAVMDVNIMIKLNLVFRNPLSPFYASNEPIEVGVSDAQAQTTQKLLEGNYAGVSKRHLMIASIIAHELGHALHPVSNPLSSYAWSLLEGQYDLSDNRTDPQSQIYPSFTGHGHLEGSPTGNLSANFEFKFGKSFVENGIWKEADRLIKIYGSIVNEKSDKFNFKKDIVPNHLDITTLNPNELKFEVSTYLRGNLTLLPKDLPVNIKGND